MLDNNSKAVALEKSRASEVDLVIDAQGMTIPIEIKYCDTWDKKCIHTFDVFKEKHKEKNLKVPFCLILYRGDFVALDDNVFCIPAWAFC